MFDTKVLDSTPLNLVSCLHPVEVTVCGEKHYFPCGHCSRCLSNIANYRKSLVDFAFSVYKYGVFVTLTYDDENCPVFKVYKGKYLDFVNREIQQNSNLFPYAELKETINRKELESVSKILSRRYGQYSYNSDAVRYLNKNDVQNFIKRVFRYVRKDNPTAPLAYCGCGEYGPHLLRPHFHLLFFTDSPETLSRLLKCADSLWRYGTSNTQLAYSNSASSYISTYIGGSQSVPEILKIRGFKPYFFHSKGLTARSLKSLVKTVRTLQPEEVADVILLKSVDDKERNRRWSHFCQLFRKPLSFDYVHMFGFTSFLHEVFGTVRTYAVLDSSVSLSAACRSLAFKYMSGSVTVQSSYFLTDKDPLVYYQFRAGVRTEAVLDAFQCCFSRLYYTLLMLRHYWYLCFESVPFYTAYFDTSRIRFFSDWLSDLWRRCAQVDASYHIRSQYYKLQAASPEVYEAFFRYCSDGCLEHFDDCDTIVSYYDNLLTKKDKSKRINEFLLFNN